LPQRPYERAAAVYFLRHFPSAGAWAPTFRDFFAACCLVVFGLSSPAEAGAIICPGET
jgi:hypothetical protein